MKQAGLSDEQAIETSLRLLGSARQVAHEIYATHSQGTWREALLAGLPHLFFAALFALNWLTGITWVPVIVIMVAGITFYGFSHGRPGWLFPWLGYALFPVAAAGVSMLYLPRGLAWVILLLYIPSVLWRCSCVHIMWTAFTFLVMAVSTALFVRSSSRAFRTLSLVSAGLITLAVVVLASDQLDPPTVIGLSLLTLSFIAVPVFVDRRQRRARHQAAQ
jgi:hypothetical protein